MHVFVRMRRIDVMERLLTQFLYVCNCRQGGIHTVCKELNGSFRSFGFPKRLLCRFMNLDSFKGITAIISPSSNVICRVIITPCHLPRRKICCYRCGTIFMAFLLIVSASSSSSTLIPRRKLVSIVCINVHHSSQGSILTDRSSPRFGNKDIIDRWIGSRSASTKVRNLGSQYPKLNRVGYWISWIVAPHHFPQIPSGYPVLPRPLSGGKCRKRCWRCGWKYRSELFGLIIFSQKGLGWQVLIYNIVAQAIAKNQNDVLPSGSTHQID
mmetsp:Transcript_33097/g.54660  ORF Transcript_33097/g.54660 Transcript_33097/m.54660 type:complete len:268 (-) Transcript_33097:408-1211(-)